MVDEISNKKQTLPGFLRTAKKCAQKKNHSDKDKKIKIIHTVALG
jgi:hypothetical protein